MFAFGEREGFNKTPSTFDRVEGGLTPFQHPLPSKTLMPLGEAHILVRWHVRTDYWTLVNSHSIKKYTFDFQLHIPNASLQLLLVCCRCDLRTFMNLYPSKGYVLLLAIRILKLAFTLTFVEYLFQSRKHSSHFHCSEKMLLKFFACPLPVVAADIFCQYRKTLLIKVCIFCSSPKETAFMRLVLGFCRGEYA
jgi:hypothetical protein